MQPSPKYSLNSQDLKSVAVTVLIVGVSAVIAQLLVIIPVIDFGKNTALITLILISILKLIQKYLDGIPTSKLATPQPQQSQKVTQ